MAPSSAEGYAAAATSYKVDLADPIEGNGGANLPLASAAPFIVATDNRISTTLAERISFYSTYPPPMRNWC